MRFLSTASAAQRALKFGVRSQLRPSILAIAPRQKIFTPRNITTPPTSTTVPFEKPYYITTPIFYVNAGTTIGKQTEINRH